VNSKNILADNYPRVFFEPELEDDMTKVLLSTALYGLLCSGLACSDGSEGDSQTEESAIQTIAYAEDTLLYRQAATSLVQEFQTELKSELMAALNAGGAVNAIQVCRKKAPGIQAETSGDTWMIKRVSQKYRNPDNRADSTEVTILSRFADSTAPAHLEDWQITDSSVTYTYYQPIYTMPLCLNCHGDLQTLAPGVMAALKKHYPLDRATGYRSGELRGVFVVRADWPEGRMEAQALLTDSL
jgi:hypothetical protein